MLKKLLTTSILFLQLTSILCGKPTQPIEKSGFLSLFKWGMLKEEVMRICSDEEEFTLINDSVEFFKNYGIQDEGESLKILMQFSYSLEFQKNRLVKIFRGFIDNRLTEEMGYALNKSFVGIYTEKFGTPVVLNESMEKEGCKMIVSKWETEHLRLANVFVPALKGISTTYLSKEYSSENKNSGQIAIKNLWFGIIRGGTEGEIQKLEETRKIPLDTTIWFALLFDIDSEESVSIKLGQAMPGRFRAINEVTGKELPYEKGYYISDCGKVKKKFSTKMRLDKDDPLGKYKIKIFINNRIIGMLNFDVVSPKE